ncbi:MAG: hypothetical protein QOJ57_266 [Thermoleophilaceae bacterium]|nr:hypothetical protein [Thermoleophilaceae bacterium]
MTPRLKLMLVAALACAAMVPLATAPAHAAKGMEVAVQDDSIFVIQLPRPGYRAKGLNLATQMQVSWIRANVNWNYVTLKYRKKKKEPKNIVYNWTGYDALIQDAAAKGINVQLALTGPAPAWATGNHKVGVDRIKAAPFKRFAKAAAEHFRGRVHRYSIWNEPNHRSWISPIKSQAKIYRGLYTGGYSAIKTADPDAQVLIGETSPFSLGRGRNAQSPLKFLRGVTCANARYKKARNCATLKADGYAHHPYDFDHKPTYRYPGKDNVTLGVLGRLTSALGKLRKAKLLTTPSGGTPDLYLTEYGYFGSGKRGVSRAKQGSYLVKAFTIAQKNPRVRQMLQYLFVYPGSRYAFFDTSIATRKATPTLAFKKLAAWARKAAKAGRIAVPTK